MSDQPNCKRKRGQRGRSAAIILGGGVMQQKKQRGGNGRFKGRRRQRGSGTKKRITRTNRGRNVNVLLTLAREAGKLGAKYLPKVGNYALKGAKYGGKQLALSALKNAYKIPDEIDKVVKKIRKKGGKKFTIRKA